MKPKFLAIAASILAAGSFSYAAPASTPSAPSDSRVQIVFDHPENFTDFKDSQYANEKVQKAYSAMLTEHIQKRAEKLLPEGQKLTVTISDVDMAGDFEPWRGPNFSDVRIVKDIYPPRIKLSYQITDANGAVVKEGKRELQDLTFQMRRTMAFQDDPLRYEKELLDDWLRQDIAPAKKK